MAQTTILVNGQDSLADQENALNFKEQTLSAKVIQYSKKTAGAAAGTKPNEAVLEDMPIDETLHPLFLVALDAAADPSTAKPPQAGQAMAFHGTAYVSGVEKLVVGFRQP